MYSFLLRIVSTEFPQESKLYQIEINLQIKSDWQESLLALMSLVCEVHFLFLAKMAPVRKFNITRVDFMS